MTEQVVAGLPGAPEENCVLSACCFNMGGVRIKMIDRYNIKEGLSGPFPCSYYCCMLCLFCQMANEIQVQNNGDFGLLGSWAPKGNAPMKGGPGLGPL
eukprot:gene2576-21431_t